MIPDIVEIKRLCASGQWYTKIENGKILLHDTVAGETVCIGQTDAEPVRRGKWIDKNGYTVCSNCGMLGYTPWKRCQVCEAKMDLEDA